MNKLIGVKPALFAGEQGMHPIEPDELEGMVYEACKATFCELVAAHPNERFYTFGLWTDDSLQFLHPAANTEEALMRTVQHYRKNVDPKYGGTSTTANMRWAYGDWGFFPADIGEVHFASINQRLKGIFDLNVHLEQFGNLIDPLRDAIVKGFWRLDQEGFFGIGATRSDVTLLLVGDLPEELIEQYARILNPEHVADRFANWDHGKG